MFRVWIVALLAFSWLLAAADVLPAQEEPAGEQPAAQPAAAPAAAEAAAEGDSPAALREQTIYIPYSRLRSIFEQRRTRSVHSLQPVSGTLESGSLGRARRIEDYKPPIGALLVEIDSQATVGRDVMNVDARLAIEVLTEGWHQIPLRLKESAIRSAKIGDKPARILFSPETGYSAAAPEGGEAARADRADSAVQQGLRQSPRHQQRAVRRSAGSGESLADQDCRSGGEGERASEPFGQRRFAEMDDIPRHPATIRPSGPSRGQGRRSCKRLSARPTTSGSTGPPRPREPPVSPPWPPCRPGRKCSIDEGVIRTRAHLAYEITRADVTQLVVEVPADHNVVNVFDPNVQKWEKKVEGPLQTLTITLFQPTRGTQNIAVELEKIRRRQGDAAGNDERAS